MQDNNFKYITVMFEDKFNSTPENPKFYGKDYLYKTKRELKEGQIIDLDTNYGHSKVVVYKSNIPEEKALLEANNIGLSLEDLKEIL